AYALKSANTDANLLGAQKHLREPVRLDPKFALSWALLSYVDARGYITGQTTVALREETRQAAEPALTLHPNLGDAVLSKGQYHSGRCRYRGVQSGYLTSRRRSIASLGAPRSAPPGRRRHQRRGDTSVPSDPGAQACTNHRSAKGNTCQA